MIGSVAGRLAARNILRRPAEALLVVIGAMLGTSIIAAALVIGDSFDGSIRDGARTQLGPIDEIVQVRAGPDDLDRRVAQLADRLAHTSLRHVDGLLTARMAGAVLSSGRTQDTGSPDPNTCVMEVSPAEVRHFGPDPELGGFARIRHEPAAGTTFMGRDVASRLGLSTGDTVQVAAYGSARSFRVTRLIEPVGVAGYCDALVPAGSIAELARSAPEGRAEMAELPLGAVFVSNNGGLEDSVDHSEQVTEQLRAVTAGFDAEVRPLKADLLENAERTGGNLRTLFSAIGGFSVAAGVLLLINLVVMLAEERKVELGVLRAIGLRRGAVWRSFCIEGFIYSAASAVLGTALGIGVARLVISGAGRVFGDPDDPSQLLVVLRPAALAGSVAIGFGISALTVAATSGRIARLNIIAAIRDLPSHHVVRRTRWATLIACLGVAVGVAEFAIGFTRPSPELLFSSPPLIAWSTASLLAHRLPRRLVATTGAAFVIAWCLAVFPLFPREMEQPRITVFVEMGLIMVAAAVVLATNLDRLWARLIRMLTAHGRGVAVHLALAYPLARRFRTGMLLAMFSLVIFTMTFLGTFSAILGDSAPNGARDSSAGFDLIVDSNPSNPLDPTDISRDRDVAGVAVLVRGSAEFTNGYQPEPTTWPLTGFDEAFLGHGAPALLARDRRFRTDRDAFEHVLDDPGAIIVGTEFLQSSTAPATEEPEVGDRVVARNRSGEQVRLRVAGVLRSDYPIHGALVSAERARSLLAPTYSENRMFVRLQAGESADLVARRLARSFSNNGTSARTFLELADDQLSRMADFIRLMQAYLGFGLLIGLAGLGVVMVRAVRERRREIGMLRAMGTQARLVRQGFLLEAVFVAAHAVTIGITLALLTAAQVVVRSGAFSNATVEFVVPWATVATLVVVPLLVTMLTTLVPARNAAAIRPARALRELG
ncbi:MAG: ABC transporter permease [Microthrixaceae bacterium]|nr:ABC transporter permease [Microthrixaceae bacterium]